MSPCQFLYSGYGLDPDECGQPADLECDECGMITCEDHARRVLPAGVFCERCHAYRELAR